MFRGKWIVALQKTNQSLKLVIDIVTLTQHEQFEFAWGICTEVESTLDTNITKLN